MEEWFLKYWIEFVFGLVILILTTSFNMLKNKVKCANMEQEAIKGGIQALLRDRIIQAYNKYNDLGYIPIYGLENVEAMYKQYHNLGGNGTITKLMETLRDLPTENKER